MRLYLMLSFVLGVGAGIGLTAVLVPGLDDGLPKQPQAITPVSATSDSNLVRTLQGALAEAELALTAEVQKSSALRAELNQANSRLNLELAENEDQLDADAARAERRRSRFEASLASRSERRLEAYKRAADLRPEQESALEGIMEQYTANQIARAEARRNGTEPPPEIDLSQLLSTVLDPNQVAAVESFQKEVRQGRDETRATARMNSIAPTLGLSNDQKDAVFGAYYTRISNNTDSNAADQTLASEMRQILSPQQYDEWQQLNLE